MASGTTALVGRQLDEFFLGWKFAEIASIGASPFLFLAGGLGRLVVESFETIGAIGGGLLFGFLAEELLLQPTILGAEVFVFLLEDGDSFEGAGMHAFPIPDLLAEFEIFPAQRRNFNAELREFRTQFANTIDPVAEVKIRPAVFEHKAIHDLPNLPRSARFRKAQVR
jgi:hypothetical protein